MGTAELSRQLVGPFTVQGEAAQGLMDQGTPSWRLLLWGDLLAAEVKAPYR